MKQNKIKITHLFIFCLILFSIDFAQGKKPNILFIFSDDQSYETLGALGDSEVSTPHIDSLASAGIVFSHAYNMGAWRGAVCLASRAMLNSGRMLWKAEALDEGSKMNEEVAAGRFWSEIMKSAGYRTYITGKWHVKTSAPNTFNVTGTVRAGGMPKTKNSSYNRPLNVNDPTDTWKPWDKTLGGYWAGGKHWSEVVADETIGFLEQASNRSEPFFIYAAFNAVHDPRQAPKSYVDKYPWDKIKVPDNFLPEYPYKDAIGNSSSLRDEKLAPFPRTRYSIQVHRSEYFAIMEHMDDQIGRIFAKLKASGLDSNTYVIFTSDHGLAVGHHGFLGKQNMYDHSIRVPLFLSGPGIAKGSRVDKRVYLQDVMPTTLEIAGVSKPAYVEFNSLLPFVRDTLKKSNYQAVYGAYKDIQRMVLVGDYKLIHYPNASKKIRIYNLKDDPKELTDLAGSKKYSLLEKNLWDELMKLQTDLQDDFTLVYKPATVNMSEAGCMDDLYMEYKTSATILDISACLTLKPLSIREAFSLSKEMIISNGQLKILGQGAYDLKVFDTKGNLLISKQGKRGGIISMPKYSGVVIIRLSNFKGSFQKVELLK